LALLLISDARATMTEPTTSSGEAPRGDSEVTEEMIAARAYEISVSDQSATAEENWQRAERELRGDSPPSS
jgi:hypothetical protein